MEIANNPIQLKVRLRAVNTITEISRCAMHTYIQHVKYKIGIRETAIIFLKRLNPIISELRRKK